MISHAYTAPVYGCLRPRPFVSTADWCQRYLVMPPDAKLSGKYRLDLFPYFREVMDCFDDPDIETITVQTASQVGKTQFAIACMAKMAATNPHPMAFADADERSTKRVISRMWRQFEHCEPLKSVLPSRRLRAADAMKLSTCIIHGAWAGSAASAADFGSYVSVLNEVDKMRTAATSSEADFRELMKSRSKGYIGYKILQISTPSLTEGSYVEAERLRGDNRAFLVPCPHCRHYQQLQTGDGKKPGGIRFQKLKGKLDPRTARDTAWYECESCLDRIEEEQRFAMISAGVWCPEGCRVTSDGKLTGTPLREGTHASFGPLSTLCSLLPGINFGVFAEHWVNALIGIGELRREKIRDHINSWDGRTWNPQPSQITDDLVRTRCGVPDSPRVVPSWASFVTRGVDVGRVGDQLIFYWLAIACGAHQRTQLLDFGLWMSPEEFLRGIRTQTFPLEAHPIQPARTLVDSSAYASEVYQLVNPLRTLGVWAIKGEKQDPRDPFERTSGSSMWFAGMQREGLNPKIVAAKQAVGNYDLIRPNTYRSQEWLQARLDGLVTRENASGLSIPEELLTPDYLPGNSLIDHLRGDYKDQATGKWQKRYEQQHLRSCLRYAVVAAFHKVGTENAWQNLKPLTPNTPRPARPRRIVAGNDDRPFLASDR